MWVRDVQFAGDEVVELVRNRPPANRAELEHYGLSEEIISYSEVVRHAGRGGCGVAAAAHVEKPGSGYHGSGEPRRSRRDRRMRPTRNTVHLALRGCYTASLRRNQGGSVHGTHAGGTARGGSDDGLYQSGSDREDLSGHAGSGNPGPLRAGQSATARLAGPGGGVLRHRPGPVHAGLVPGGAALPPGRRGLVAGTGPAGTRGREVRNLAGPRGWASSPCANSTRRWSSRSPRHERRGPGIAAGG